jgi:hypothetical protein
MSTYANKTQKDKSEAVANNSPEFKSNGQNTSQFIDNRPGAIAQRKLQIAINNSPKVKQLQAYQKMADNYTSKIIQRKENAGNRSLEPIQRKENHTGLPDNLKSGIEKLSGYAMDDVKVHYNSDKPSQLQAHAYAQGTDIHIAPGQEKHLPHEAWHVTQQKQGRVKQTTQLKQHNINDDKSLESEADHMGRRAADISKPDVADSNIFLKSALNIQFKSDIVQRVVRYGDPYIFISSVSAIPAEILEAGISEVDLAPLINDVNVHGFETIHDIRDCLTILNEYPDFLRILQARTFRGDAAMSIPFHMKIANWLISELLELNRTITDAGLNTEMEVLRQQLTALAEEGPTLRLAHRAFLRLQKVQHGMFKLDKDRRMPHSDGHGDLSNRKYGYHLTKLHNIAGIAATGLDPAKGASNLGSLAMSTVDQQKGSFNTSKNMVAFGLQPETFRPYINQFEDRRQMIEATPMSLKPVMLRFMISNEVRENSASLAEQGITDFMDRNASNSQIPILADDIEVLTESGWVPIKKYNHEAGITELRSGDDNARGKVKWSSDGAIFDWAQLVAIEGLDLFGIAEKNWRGKGKPTDIQLMESIRDTKMGTFRGIEYTFRGATLQTSGHRKTWHYAFSVKGKSIPRWLGERIQDYKKNYSGLAIAQMQGAEEALKKPKGGASLEEVEGRFTVGHADGNELNCLLETVDQLYRDTQGSNAGHVQEMREILSGFGLAPESGMIDVYGGAGMQLANDLNIRIQIIQQHGGGYITHPVMGISGRIVYILHTPGHFSPLWPK